MKKNLFYSISFLFLGVSGHAQFYGEWGVSIFYGLSHLPNGTATEMKKPSLLGYGLFAYPRINIFQFENQSLSLGAPSTIGINASSNGGGSEVGLAVDLPLMVSVNFGAGSSKNNEFSFGGFIGGGFGYTYTNQKYTYSGLGWSASEYFKGRSYGPVLEAGLRMKISKQLWFIRFSGKLGLEAEKFRTFGFALGTTP